MKERTSPLPGAASGPQVEDQGAAYQTEPEARSDERNQRSGRKARKDTE